MIKKILLTGASGEVGYEAFKELLKRKDQYDIRILNLDNKRERKIFEPYLDQIEVVWGDIRNPNDVCLAVEGVDAVLHVAGIIPPLADEHPALAHEVNVGGTRNILAAIQAQNPQPKMIYTSSISVYGDRLENPHISLGDSLQPSDGDEYARTKMEAEELIRQAGVPWTIFRLCGILTSRLKIQPLMFHMPLGTALEWCHRSDVGYALVEALEHEELLGRIFNLGGGERCQIKAKDFVYKMFSLYGLKPAALPAHAFAIKNFHSGYYTDGDELEALLHFQNHTLDGYFEAVMRQISAVQRFFVRLIPAWAVRKYFVRLSEPLQAIRENNRKLIARFYGSRRNFEILVREIQKSVRPMPDSV